MADMLSFTTSTAVFECEGSEKYVHVAVRPLVNGVPIVENAYCFDLAAILALGATSWTRDIYTCDCGNAGCAGIFEDCKIEVSEATVAWKFPDDPFKKMAHPLHVNSRERLVFTFERGQYFASLRNLVNEILLIEENSTLPVNYHCDSVYMVEDIADSVSDRMIEDKLRLEAWISSENKRRECFGPLVNSTVMITMDQGIVLKIGVENLLRDIASQRADDMDEVDYIAEKLVPEALANRDYLVNLVRQMSWSDVWQKSWVDQAGNETETASIEAMMPFLYPGAAITFKSAD